MTVNLERLIRFVGADKEYDLAQKAREDAEARFKAAREEFSAAWDAMTKHEQTELQAAYDARMAGKQP